MRIVSSQWAWCDPTLELLCLLLQDTSDPRISKRIESLLPTVDGNRFLDLAIRHAVVARVYQGGDGFVSTGMKPLPWWPSLAELSRSATRKAFLQAAESARLLRSFRAVGIEVMPFKGPALSAFLYDGDPALRQSDDLDFFVRKEELWKCRDQLLTDGYILAEPRLPRQENWVRDHRSAMHFYKPNRQVGVDLHWRLFDTIFPFAIDHEGIWQRARPFLFMKQETGRASASDLFFLLALHGSWHFWFRLGWICDLLALVNRSDLDWLQIRELAQDSGTEVLVDTAVHIMKAVFPNTPIPAWPANRPIKVNRLVHICLRRIEENKALNTISEYRRFSRYLPLRAGLLLLWRLTFTTNKWDRAIVRLPLWLEPMYRCCDHFGFYSNMACAPYVFS